MADRPALSLLEQQRLAAGVSRVALAAQIGGSLGTESKVWRIERNPEGSRTTEAEVRAYLRALAELASGNAKSGAVEEPAPGRLVSLGEELDLADAEDLLAVIRAAARVRERHSSGPAMHLAREALWDIWEHRRLPRPLVSSKYPHIYPWSPAARNVWEQNRGQRPPGGWGLVLEHTRPRGILMSDLLDRASSLTADSLAAQLVEHLAGAVVTSADDRALAAAGVASSLPAGDSGSDPWARYRAAGFVPSDFAPLTD